MEYRRLGHLFILSALLLISCREERINNRFAGAWEVESIRVTWYDSTGMPVSDTTWSDCGTWAFVDNGLSGSTLNTSMLVLNEFIPCLFAAELTPDNQSKYSGMVYWGSDPQTESRILFEINKGDLILNVSRLNKNTLEFFHVIRNGNHASLREKQEFRLRRVKG